MPNHFQALVLFAMAVSAAFALLSKHTVGERIGYLVWSFLGFLAVAACCALAVVTDTSKRNAHTAVTSIHPAPRVIRWLMGLVSVIVRSLL